MKSISLKLRRNRRGAGSKPAAPRLVSAHGLRARKVETSGTSGTDPQTGDPQTGSLDPAGKSDCATGLPPTLVLAICAVFACCAALAARGPQAAALKDVLNRLDQAAKAFHSTSARISWTKHTAVLNDDSTQTGVVYRARTPKGLLGRIDIATPEKKGYAFEGRTVQIYYPNIKEVDIYDAGAQGEQLEEFLMLGFGTSGMDLEKTYEVRFMGTETVKGEKAVHLALIPKSGEARKLVKQVDLWISERANYPVHLLDEILSLCRFRGTPGGNGNGKWREGDPPGADSEIGKG